MIFWKMQLIFRGDLMKLWINMKWNEQCTKNLYSVRVFQKCFRVLSKILNSLRNSRKLLWLAKNTNSTQFLFLATQKKSSSMECWWRPENPRKLANRCLFIKQFFLFKNLIQEVFEVANHKFDQKMLVQQIWRQVDMVSKNVIRVDSKP